MGRLTVASTSQLMENHYKRGVVRSRKVFKFRRTPTISVERLQVVLSRRSSQVLSA